ncbi:4Fe-4S dicluster domain-containing protein [Desulfosporosinus sp. BICA1-9]|uniref:4Fe-4S dicluster domain-containing protein n=1 Tax=Desulfosporosinus sp. BICA1-9 TaxID=1531958 RepID=UPI00054C6394|nr:4Fe-4S dicluster domain-containing protein [Desulfosporosinus sp. BICA1-9]KJS46839.1 MAG: 4Fe-4S ferredoxin [Peptococcaceae bacterium BRH_c23]KJS80105.1 MAG: 4Fe-4S ferredoxin [Desulfosporosinus sp. BICA1-9]HBW34868.1 4Fe-4S dicluster domain-containing protein [Desulfosporosinus sp.]
MDEQLVPIYVMGKHYQVPEGLTIMTAMEWVGYKYVRGCGCRGGFCGACSTVYRLPGQHKLMVGLACQTTITPTMHLMQIPFFPNPKKIYDLEKVENPVQALLDIFPEITKCVGCGACAKACPNNLRPIDYVAAALRGDWEKAAELSFDCIMCGLCASRCTGELVPHNIALFVRRYYSKVVRPKPQQLLNRNQEIREGKFDTSLSDFAKLDEAKLRKMYDERDFEKI